MDWSLQEIGFADLDVEDEEAPSAPVEDEEASSHSQPAGAFSALEADGGDAPEPKEESSIFGGKIALQKPPSASLLPAEPHKRGASLLVGGDQSINRDRLSSSLAPQQHLKKTYNANYPLSWGICVAHLLFAVCRQEKEEVQAGG